MFRDELTNKLHKYMNDKIGGKHNEDVHAGMQDIPANNNNKGSDSQAFLFQWNYRKSSFDGRGGGGGGGAYLI